MIQVTDQKQVRLLKLLHEGSLPLSKARIRLNDNRPKVTVDRLNLFFANTISSCGQDIFGKWQRAELRFLIGYGLTGQKEQIIKLNGNVEILNFYPDKDNPEMVTLRIIRRTSQHARPCANAASAITSPS